MKYILESLRLKFIIGLFLVLIFQENHALASSKVQDIVLFESFGSASKHKSPDARFSQEALKARLAYGMFGQPTDFSLVAKVTVNTSDQDVISHVQDFATRGLIDESRGAWRRRGSSYVFTEPIGGAVEPLPINLSALTVGHIREIDEIWLDYAEIPGLPLCKPVLKIDGTAIPFGKEGHGFPVKAETESPHVYVLEKLIEIDKAEWKPKDRLYLAKRIIGWRPDSVWRYTQDKEMAVFQRRFDTTLGGVKALELTSRRAIERVNLRVSVDGAAPILLEYSGLDQSLPNGLSGVRLDLLDQLKRHPSGTIRKSAANQASLNLQLKEVIIFMSGDAASLVSAKALDNLSFLKSRYKFLESQFGDGVVHLTSKIEQISGGKHRLRANLRNLESKGSFELNSMSWELTPAGANCGIRLFQTRGLNFRNTKVPKFASALERWNRQHGGPFLQNLPESGNVESPGLLALLPFSTLATQNIRDASPAKRSTSDDIGFITADNRVLQPLKRVTAQGAVIQLSSGPKSESSIYRKENRLVVEGSAPKITVDWQLNRSLPSGSYFFLDIPSGVEKLEGIELQLEDTSGKRHQFPLVANAPIMLEHFPTGVIHLARLILRPMQAPYSIELNEAAFFAPQVMDYSQAFKNQALPYRRIIEPTVETISGDVISAKPGHAVIWHHGKPVRFRTVLQPGLNWLQGLSLAYRIPLVALRQNCQINLRLEWEQGITERQICFTKLTDSIQISGAWLSEVSRSLGLLKAVVWDLPAFPAQDHSLNPTELNFSFEGITFETAESRLNYASLGTLNDRVVQSSGPGKFDQPYRQRMSIPLADKWFNVMFNEHANSMFKVTSNEFFTLDSIVATPLKRLDLREWQALNLAPPVETTGVLSPKWLFGLFVLLLVGGSSRIGWWSAGAPFIYAKEKGAALYRFLFRGIYSIGRYVWQRMHWLNFLVGLFVLPGVWLAGRFAGDYSGWMLLSSTCILAWAVARHRISGVQLSVHEASVKWLKADRLLALIAAGNLLWALGKFRVLVDVLWACLPLLAVGYLMLPYIYRVALAWECRYPGLARSFYWLALSSSLYAFGMVMPVRIGGSYFFFFGSMAAVFGFRSLLLLLEPWVRQVAPRLAEAVFGRASSLYFASALFGVICTALLLSLKLDAAAEQIAVVVYYCLVVGIVLELIALRRERRASESAK